MLDAEDPASSTDLEVPDLKELLVQLDRWKPQHNHLGETVDVAAELELRLIQNRKQAKNTSYSPTILHTHTRGRMPHGSSDRHIATWYMLRKKTERASEMFTDGGAIRHACLFKETGEDSFQILGRLGSHRLRQSGSQQKLQKCTNGGTSLLVQRRRHRASRAGGPASIPGQGARSCLPQGRSCTLQ